MSRGISEIVDPLLTFSRDFGDIKIKKNCYNCSNSDPQVDLVKYEKISVMLDPSLQLLKNFEGIIHYASVIQMVLFNVI